MERIDRPGGLPGFEEFSGCRGGRFLVSVTERLVVELTLVEATALPAWAHPGCSLPFSVVFQGPKNPRLSQGIHSFENEVLGPFEIFIVPIAPVEQGPQYEAVFN